MELRASQKPENVFTDVKWLWIGIVLVRVFDLFSEISAFFAEHPAHLLNCLSATWLQKLAYTADIFTKTNEANLSLQGRVISIFITAD
jgi:hypothetical protein